LWGAKKKTEWGRAPSGPLKPPKTVGGRGIVPGGGGLTSRQVDPGQRCSKVWYAFCENCGNQGTRPEISKKKQGGECWGRN